MTAIQTDCVRMLGEWGARISSYTQICRRQKELNIPLGVKYSKDKPVDIAIGSTGIKAFNRGEWIRQKWAAERDGNKRCSRERNDFSKRINDHR